jgi:nitrogen fixation protein FixH
MSITASTESAVTQARDETAAPRRRSRIPLLFFAFFGVVFSANGVLIYTALSTWTGLETKNSYIKGRDYNQVLAQIEAQEALGWGVDSALVHAGTPGTYTVTLRLVDADGAPLTGAEAVARIERPTHHGIDVRADLNETAPGLYTAAVTLPAAGQWQIRSLVWHGENTHQKIERLVLPTAEF